MRVAFQVLLFLGLGSVSFGQSVDFKLDEGLKVIRRCYEAGKVYESQQTMAKNLVGVGTGEAKEKAVALIRNSNQIESKCLAGLGSARENSFGIPVASVEKKISEAMASCYNAGKEHSRLVALFVKTPSNQTAALSDISRKANRIEAICTGETIGN